MAYSMSALGDAWEVDPKIASPRPRPSPEAGVDGPAIGNQAVLRRMADAQVKAGDGGLAKGGAGGDSGNGAAGAQPGKAKAKQGAQKGEPEPECPPKKAVKAETLKDYADLLACAEERMQLGPRDMLALFRQLYYGKSWSLNTTEQWAKVIPCSPEVGNPAAELGPVLFASLRMSRLVEGVDIGHVFTGLESMTCPSESVDMYLDIDMSNEEFSTWGGDLGSAVAIKRACDDLGAAAAEHDLCGSLPGGQPLDFHLQRHVSDSDLESDIDSFVMRAQVLGVPCAGSAQTKLVLPAGKPVSALIKDYYAPAKSDLLKARSNRHGCMLEILGAQLRQGKIINRVDLLHKLSPRVNSFAALFYEKTSKDFMGTADYIKSRAVRGLTSTWNTDRAAAMSALSAWSVHWFLSWLERRLR